MHPDIELVQHIAFTSQHVSVEFSESAVEQYLGYPVDEFANQFCCLVVAIGGASAFPAIVLSLNTEDSRLPPEQRLMMICLQVRNGEAWSRITLCHIESWSRIPSAVSSSVPCLSIPSI